MPGGRGAQRPKTLAARRSGRPFGYLTDGHDANWPTVTQAAEAIANALRPPDPRYISGPVRRYAPTGELIETVSVSDWITRYPHRFTARRGANRRTPPRPIPAIATADE